MRSGTETPPIWNVPAWVYWAARYVILVILWLPLKLWFGFRVRGRENMEGLKGCVVVSNHIHQLDCVMLQSAMPPRRIWTLSLPSNLTLPVVGPIVRLMGAVTVPKDAAGYRQLYRHLEDGFSKGHLLLVYPEGSRQNWCPTLREFQSGAFRFAQRFNVPVVPCVFRQYKRRGLIRRGLELVILPPLEAPKELSARAGAEYLRDAAYQAMGNSTYHTVNNEKAITG